jgi:hypothetical protein
MKRNNLKKGELIVFDVEPIELYEGSSHYSSDEENQVIIRVLPDEQNWFTCLTNNGKVALHKDELSLSRVAFDEHGNKVRVIRGEFTLVEGHSNDVGVKYFLNELAAENCGYKFSLRLNQFHDVNDSDFYGEEKLLNYHTSQQRIDRSRLKNFSIETDELLCGIEVEKTDATQQQIGDAWKILDETGWAKERDGSLGSYGYEMVSPILPLFDVERIQKAIEPVRAWINANCDEKCGGHITLSKKGVTTEDLLKQFKHFAPVLYSLYPKRCTNEYCMAREWNKYFTYREKRSAFFMKDYQEAINGRLEIRLFSRIKTEKDIQWRIELLQMFFNNKECNLNQFVQKIACSENDFYIHFRKAYSHERIAEKLRLIDVMSKRYGTHRNGISPSVKKRVNALMGMDVFEI